MAEFKRPPGPQSTGRKVKEQKQSAGDTTVVEANIHHPTDSSLIADAVSLSFKGKRSRGAPSMSNSPGSDGSKRWRAGQEGTISELKRRYRLARTLYRGLESCRRWVGGAIWGYNLNRVAKLI